MKSFLRSSLLKIIVGFIFAIPNAEAAYSVKIAGGPPTGEYITFARAICETALGELFNCPSVAWETKGAQANKELLESGSADIGIIKGNLVQDWMQDSYFTKYTVVRELPGEAVMVIMTPKTAKAVVNWGGIRENSFLISFGLPGKQSGDTSVFNALRALKDSPLKDAAKVEILADRPALIDAIVSGKVQVGFVVQYPNPNNKLFELVNNAGLVIMGVVDPDFPAIAPVDVDNVTVSNAKWGKTSTVINTVTIKPAIIARIPDIYSDPIAKKTMALAIKKIGNVELSKLLPETSWAQDMLNWASQRAANFSIKDAYSNLLVAAKDAKENLKALANK